MSRQVAAYYVGAGGVERRKFVLPAPTDDDVKHYLELEADRQAGIVHPAVGLFDFHEVDLDRDMLGPRIPAFVAEGHGMRAIRVEELTTRDTAEQGDLLDQDDDVMEMGDAA